nr:DUF6069 family protein [Ruania alba]
MTMAIGAVLVAGLVSALLGWAAGAMLEHLTRRADTVWTITAADGAASVVVVALHLVVGTTLIIGLPARSRRGA